MRGSFYSLGKYISLAMIICLARVFCALFKETCTCARRGEIEWEE